MGIQLADTRIITRARALKPERNVSGDLAALKHHDPISEHDGVTMMAVN